MRPRAFASLLAVLSMAEACGPSWQELEPLLDAGADAVDETEPRGGIRLLSDVSAPTESDAWGAMGPGRDGAGIAPGDAPSDLASRSGDRPGDARDSDAAAFAFTSCAAVRDCMRGG